MVWTQECFNPPDQTTDLIVREYKSFIRLFETERYPSFGLELFLLGCISAPIEG